MHLHIKQSPTYLATQRYFILAAAIDPVINLYTIAGLYTKRKKEVQCIKEVPCRKKYCHSNHALSPSINSEVIAHLQIQYFYMCYTRALQLTMVGKNNLHT